MNFYLECKKLDGILSILEVVVLYFKLCAVLGRREFHPHRNSNLLLQGNHNIKLSRHDSTFLVSEPVVKNQFIYLFMGPVM